MSVKSRFRLSASLLALAGSAIAGTAGAQSLPADYAAALFRAIDPDGFATVTYGTPVAEDGSIVIPDVMIVGTEDAPPVLTGDDFSMSFEIPLPPVHIDRIVLQNPALDADGMLTVDEMLAQGISSSFDEGEVTIEHVLIVQPDLAAFWASMDYSTIDLEDMDEFASWLEAAMMIPSPYAYLEIANIAVSADGQELVTIASIASEESGDQSLAWSRFLVDDIAIHIPPEELNGDMQAALKAMGIDTLVIDILGAASYDYETGNASLDQFTIDVAGVGQLVMTYQMDGMTPAAIVAIVEGDFDNIPSRFYFSVDDFSFALPTSLFDRDVADVFKSMGLDTLAVSSGGAFEWDIANGTMGLYGLRLSADGIANLLLSIGAEGIDLADMIEGGDQFPSRIWLDLADASVTVPAALVESPEFAALGIDPLTVSVSGGMDWNEETATFLIQNFSFDADGLARLAFSLAVEGVTTELIESMTATPEYDYETGMMITPPPPAPPSRVVLTLDEAWIDLPPSMMDGGEEVLGILGLDSLELGLSGVIDWDMITGALQVSDATVSIGGIGTMTLSFSVEGLTPDAVMALEALTAPEPSIQALAQVSTVTLSSIDYRFVDGGALGTLLQRVAAEEGRPLEDIIAEVVAQARTMLASPDAPEQASAIAAEIGEFLRNPRELVMTARPPVPLSFLEIYVISNGMPGMLLGPYGLNVTVDANPGE